MTAPDARPAAGGRSLRPTKADLTDLGFSLALVALGVVGFDSAFGGAEAFTVGLPAMVVGAAVAYLVAKVRPPILVGAAIGILFLFLFGGALALREDAIAGVLPSLEVLSGLVDGTVNGWARLITSVPPAGQAGNLLAIPYLAGFAGGYLTVLAALLVRRWPLCVAPPVAVLALSVLFGVKEPASLLLQGGLFGAVTIGWLALRVDRTNRPAVLHPSRTRLVGSIGLLAVGMLGALVIGPRLPFADANERYVLREHVKPPFDPSQYPSPLGRFRKFHGAIKEGLLPDPVFTVEGLPPGQPVRVAVMDAYDGFVWRASEAGSDIGGSYQRVGDHIPGAAPGESVTARFTMGSLAKKDSVWIPTFGSPTAISFGGPNARTLREEFRFNRTTDTAASPVALAEGDVWEVTATHRDPPPVEELRTLSAAAIQVVPPQGYEDSSELIELAQQWIDGASTPYAQVEGLIAELSKVGATNDGEPAIASGHSFARLSSFLLASQPQGNDEQFAAAVAYLATGLRIPARVVLEFLPEGTGKGPVEVSHDDAKAVVEIALEGVGWVALPPIEPQAELTTQAAQNIPEHSEEVQPPPPVTVAPPNSIPDEPESDATDAANDDAAEGAVSRLFGVILGVLKVASIPLIVVFGPALVVTGLKARRRKRRRTQGEPAKRIASGWDEVIDLARDLGTPVPPKATRREIGRFAAVGAVATLAEEVDAAVFGHTDPHEGDADALWSQVDQVRGEMLAGKSRAERLRAKVSLTSLRGTR